MSQFKAEFTLKQHTPIIHFQSDQSGATLRATELKPKFDRFLKKYVFDGKIPKKYKISDDKDALDYKVKIESSNTKIIGFEKYPPLYFARDAKQKIISDSITITFISFNDTLLLKIKDNFEAFLTNTNFGTRQSKGYGNFYIDAKNFKKELVADEKSKVYSFKSNLQNWEQDIKLFYGLLRAGINEVDFKTKKSKFYAKSMMFMYAKSLGITWDKKAIKEHFLNRKKSNNPYLMKDLLGFSTNENWGSHKMTIKKSTKDIDRYKSPITFKPMQNGSSVTVYFFADQINKKFLNQLFKIEAKQTPLEIKTPQEFDIDNFFRFVFDIDMSLHVDNEFKKHKSFKKLEDIFSTLKAQL